MRKKRAKIKGNLDKCVEEKSLDFHDVLHTPINKADIYKIKKRSLCKVIGFLESPHATTDILLADKD